VEQVKLKETVDKNLKHVKSRWHFQFYATTGSIEYHTFSFIKKKKNVKSEQKDHFHFKGVINKRRS
jgi:hypothetical protein